MEDPMNHPDDLLDRCFRRARTAAEKPVPDGAPSGFATRVLAHWREAESRDWTLWLLPRAIGVAVLCAAAMYALPVTFPRSVEEPELGNLVMNLALGDQS
jgi:hypothetical protein